MATVLTHGVLPILAGRGFVPKDLPRKRLALAAVLCACLPDLDFLAFAYDVRPPDALAHRGFTHSLLFAAALAALFAGLIHLSKRSAPLKPVFLILFAAGASHGLLDAMTQGDAGVALLWPLTSHRFLLPVHPVPVLPLGADEVLGRYGWLVVFNEVLLLWVPALLISLAVSRRRDRPALERIGDLAAIWLIAFVVLKAAFPFELAPVPRRVVRSFGPIDSDENPSWIPRAGLPGERLVDRFGELQSLHLLDTTLTPKAEPWSSSFFPSWLGGASGRWHDGRWTLIGRTLRGDAKTLEPAEAQSVLADPAKAFLLAPTEKYDLAVGDLGFGATRESLAATHNAHPKPRFWYGICNGVATAAVERPEPFRVVDVISPGGQKVRFHPNDVKALLGAAYYWTIETVNLGARCPVVSLDPTDTCAMNPGGAVLAITNRLGLARESFLIDVHPSPQSQFYAVASAKVGVLKGPYDYDGRFLSPKLGDRVDSLLDVSIQLQGSATTLPLSAGDVPTGDPTRYQKTGLHPVPFEWVATLALDDAGTIIGGAWKDEGPDEITFVGPTPLTDGGTMLESDPHLAWPLIDAIGKASVDDDAGVPTVDVRSVLP
ncbi:MAG: metal-dependent hydrolase [Myxococcaceae bacterium]